MWSSIKGTHGGPVILPTILATLQCFVCVQHGEVPARTIPLDICPSTRFWWNVIIKSHSSIFNPLLYEVSLFSVERMGKVLQRSSRTCGRNRKQTVLWLRKKKFRPSGSFPSPLFLYGQPIAECTCAVCLSHFRIELQPSLQQPSHCKHKHYYFSQWQLVAKTSSKKNN